MKKLLYVNLLPTGSISLDPRISPHDIEHIATADAFHKMGYEVWLHEGFVRKGKKSSWPKKIERNEINKIHQFDAIIVPPLSSGFWDYVANPVKFLAEVKHGNKRGIDLLNTVEELHKFQGQIFFLIYDPRDEFILGGCPRFHSRLEHPIVNKLIDIYERIITVTPVPIEDIITFSSISDEMKTHILSKKNLICTYAWHQEQYYPTYSLRTSYQYETVYTGMASQNAKRKQIVTNMMKNHLSSFTAGPLSLKGIPNLNKKMISKTDVWNHTQNSRVSIVTAEPGHSWPTPRLYEALKCGTIPAIHSSCRFQHIIPETYERCCVNHISDIPTSREWEEETYQICLKEVTNLKNLYPLGVFDRDENGNLIPFD